MSLPPPLVLASASPARRQLLANAGIHAAIAPSHFDESQIQSANYEELVKLLAYHKAKTVADQLQEPALVLGCDSVLALQGKIYGKPADAAAAIARWQEMRGQVGDLCTGHALLDLAQNRALVRAATTQVYFAQVSDRQIVDYVATGEPLRCAGCFALEGRGGLFVEKIVGCHTNIIGLSLPLLRQMLAELGYEVTDFWATGSNQLKNLAMKG